MSRKHEYKTVSVICKILRLSENRHIQNQEVSSFPDSPPRSNFWDKDKFPQFECISS